MEEMVLVAVAGQALDLAQMTLKQVLGLAELVT
jgi:hypothetical protein